MTVDRRVNSDNHSDDSHLEIAVDVDENVLGFEVAVDELHVLHVLETEGDLHGVEPTLLLTATSLFRVVVRLPRHKSVPVL